MDTHVIINRCGTYDIAEVEAVIRGALASLGADAALFAGKKVVIKPNLVVPVSPEKCTTTHPSLVEAAARYISGLGGKVTIAESPGGPYAESLLNRTYRITGMADAAGRTGAALNYDITSHPFNTANAVTLHYFDVITPVYDADIIVSISKLKTHTLTILSAAAKNLFGVIPGVGKFGVHAIYKNQDDFQSALVDLTSALCEAKPVLSIVDAVDAMEGNGPSGGSPRHVGCIISGRNPFAVDLVCAEIIGVPNEVKMLGYAAERQLCPGSATSLRLTGDNIDLFKITDYKKPDTSRSKKFRFLPQSLAPRPVIDRKKCVGCAKCYESCPAKTIIMKQYNGKKKAEINKKDCIRCFCCQELCPAKAVNIKKNIIFGLIPKL